MTRWITYSSAILHGRITMIKRVSEQCVAEDLDPRLDQLDPKVAWGSAAFLPRFSTCLINNCCSPPFLRLTLLFLPTPSLPSFHSASSLHLHHHHGGFFARSSRRGVCGSAARTAQHPFLRMAAGSVHLHGLGLLLCSVQGEPPFTSVALLRLLRLSTKPP